jgi:hypothetical protein
MLTLVAFRSAIAITALAGLSAVGCGRSSSTTVRPMDIASDAGERAVAKYDTNHDGVLDYQELAKAPGLRAAVPTIKKMAKFHQPTPSENQLQGVKVSAAEIDSRIKQWKDRGTGRMTVGCRVIRKGSSQPVAGAEVKFVPEDVQGSGLVAGVGTTDAHGYARISQPSRGSGDPDKGMCPGFYRVEITKGSEIPAMYNTATVLGQEVAADAVGVESGAVLFELSY